MNIIILSAGLGNRLNYVFNMHKQYLWFSGIPLFCHTIKLFDDLYNIRTIYVAVPKLYIEICKKLIFYYLKPNHEIIIYSGGNNRQDSVYKGLKIIKNRVGYVLVHDAIRPFASYELLERCLEGSKKTGASIPILPINDSLIKVKKVTMSNFFKIDRNCAWLVQTPQIFDFDLLFSSYYLNKTNYVNFTDDSSILQKSGGYVIRVCGSLLNFKITTKYDLIYAKFMFKYFKCI